MKEGRRFDFVFIDADSPHAEYFQDAMRMSHPGTLIVVDNVVRNGGVADEHSNDPMVLGARRFNKAAAAEPRAAATVIQTVGAKGYDGFALAYSRVTHSRNQDDRETQDEATNLEIAYRKTLNETASCGNGAAID